MGPSGRSRQRIPLPPQVRSHQQVRLRPPSPAARQGRVVHRLRWRLAGRSRPLCPSLQPGRQARLLLLDLRRRSHRCRPVRRSRRWHRQARRRPSPQPTRSAHSAHSARWAPSARLDPRARWLRETRKPQAIRDLQTARRNRSRPTGRLPPKGPPAPPARPPTASRRGSRRGDTSISPGRFGSVRSAGERRNGCRPPELSVRIPASGSEARTCRIATSSSRSEASRSACRHTSE